MGFLDKYGGQAIESVGSIGASLIGAASAKQQMDFQERMSGTAHQREVKDMMLAGLNPILSAGSQGASTPVGTSFTPDNPAKGWVQNALVREQQNTQKTVQNLNSASASRESANAELSKAQKVVAEKQAVKEANMASLASAQEANERLRKFELEKEKEILGSDLGTTYMLYKKLGWMPGTLTSGFDLMKRGKAWLTNRAKNAIKNDDISYPILTPPLTGGK